MSNNIEQTGREAALQAELNTLKESIIKIVGNGAPTMPVIP